MGLLDDLLRQVASPAGPGGPSGVAGGGAGAIFTALNEALASHGGVQGLVGLFQQGGLGHVISSWIGTGANLPVSADQLSHVLGGDRLQQIASQLGIPAEGAAARLAESLPTLIDKATPNGTLPGADLLGKAFDIFKK